MSLRNPLLPDASHDRHFAMGSSHVTTACALLTLPAEVHLMICDVLLPGSIPFPLGSQARKLRHYFAGTVAFSERREAILALSPLVRTCRKL